MNYGVGVADTARAASVAMRFPLPPIGINRVRVVS
jgi:hypothetical protein